MSKTVPWTFQIVDVVFVSRTSTITLFLLSLYMDPFKIALIYAVHLKVANLRCYSIGLP